jgi:nondiscriminating glutamyl-tRNA synthetase
MEEAGPYAPYRQMQRLDTYEAAAQQLLADDRAYRCYCTPEELEANRHEREAAKLTSAYSGRCANLTPAERAAREAEGRRGAIRFRVRPGVVAWKDIIRDRVEIDTANLGGDFVIVRADGNPLYHFTVVVDDMAMQISHVIRGEDHVSNTPKHILLFEALGYPLPEFGHLPLILNPDGTKMSKRKSQTAVADYIA